MCVTLGVSESRVILSEAKDLEKMALHTLKRVIEYLSVTIAKVVRTMPRNEHFHRNIPRRSVFGHLPVGRETADAETSANK